MILDLNDKTDEPEFPYDAIITNYTQGQYNGDGEAIVIFNNKITPINLGHCSCFGPFGESPSEDVKDLSQYTSYSEKEFLNLRVTEFNDHKILGAYHWFKSWNKKPDYYIHNKDYFEVIKTDFGNFVSMVFAVREYETVYCGNERHFYPFDINGFEPIKDGLEELKIILL